MACNCSKEIFASHSYKWLKQLQRAKRYPITESIQSMCYTRSTKVVERHSSAKNSSGSPTQALNRITEPGTPKTEVKSDRCCALIISAVY